MLEQVLYTSVRVEASGYHTVDGMIEYIFEVTNDDEKWTISQPESAFEGLHARLGASKVWIMGIYAC
jgi:hypothetical protein